MSNLFGDNIPDAKGFADSQASKASTLGTNKINEAKSAGENKISEAQGLGENKFNEAKSYGENKLNEAKGFGESKFNEAKGFGEGKLNEARGYGDNKLNEAKGFGEGKLNEVKGFGESKLNEVNGFGGKASFSAGVSGFGGEASGSVSGAANVSTSSFGGTAAVSSSGALGGAASSGGFDQEQPSLFDNNNRKSASSPGGTKADGASSATGGAGTAKDTSTGSKKSEPKTYIVKPGDDLGEIAKKFRLPSWKYLYQINKSKIGDNPDLLKEGTELTIPQWDSTKGDELIREKGADPFAYTGGLQYRYPWVPFSLSLADKMDQKLNDFEEEKELLIYNAKTKKEIVKKKIKKSDEIELLLPDSEDIRVGIKGVPIIIRGILHQHPDDEKKSGKDTSNTTSNHEESDVS